MDKVFSDNVGEGLEPGPVFLVAATLVGLVFTTAGCSETGVEHESVSEMAKTFDEANGDREVVATVDGRPIYRAELKRLKQRRPELSTSEAIERLVERQLLFRRALKKDGLSSAELRDIRKRVLVRELLERQIPGLDGQTKNPSDKQREKSRRAFETKLEKWRKKGRVKLYPEKLSKADKEGDE